MINAATLTLNSDCYCWPIKRESILEKIIATGASDNMNAMLSERAHYFASTAIFLSPDMLAQMESQIQAIEGVINNPEYVQAIKRRNFPKHADHNQLQTQGVFMGYDFHITEDGPRLIEINSNAGGGFIVDMIEQAVGSSQGDFSKTIYDMFQSEWKRAGRTTPLKTVAIVDTEPEEQYHYPDMCLAKSLLERQGLKVVITDPKDLRISEKILYHGDSPIDLVYNRLTDFDFSEQANAVLQDAYIRNAAVITPAPHHHVLYADKRNLILLSDPQRLFEIGASPDQIDALKSIPKAGLVTSETAEMMWGKRRQLFFKPQNGFGSRGAFRGAKLTKKVWAQILQSQYIAQELIAPPVRAVTVNGNDIRLKFDVRVYTYNGVPLLHAARIYQGQTTNLRTAGGGLAPIIPIVSSSSCSKGDVAA